MRTICLIALLGASSALKTTLHLKEVSFDKIGNPSELGLGKQEAKEEKEKVEEKKEEKTEEKKVEEKKVEELGLPAKTEKKEEGPAEIAKKAPAKKEVDVYIYKPDTGSMPPKGKFNKWTGDYHDKTKERTFPEGNPVEGCNKWLQTDSSLDTKLIQTSPSSEGESM